MARYFDAAPGGGDGAFAVNNECAAGDSPDRFAEELFLLDDTVLFADGAVGIAQQGEGKLQLLPELLVGGDAVTAYAQDPGSVRCERCDFITEIAGLPCSLGSVVLGIEKENDGLAFEVFECDFLSLVRFEDKSWSFITDFHHENPTSLIRAAWI